MIINDLYYIDNEVVIFKPANMIYQSNSIKKIFYIK
nr:MAG TPA: hypothetical protein [Caudoviricetes sp.]